MSTEQDVLALSDAEILDCRVFVHDGPLTRLDRVAFARKVIAADRARAAISTQAQPPVTADQIAQNDWESAMSEAAPQPVQVAEPVRQAVLSRLADYARKAPEEGESWDEWYEAAFDLAAADIRRLMTEPQQAQGSEPDMVPVCKEDANNYSRILTVLGMEEEGDPVAAVETLIRDRDNANEALAKLGSESGEALNLQPDGGYPGCDHCTCPAGFCHQNSILRQARGGDAVGWMTPGEQMEAGELFVELHAVLKEVGITDVNLRSPAILRADIPKLRARLHPAANDPRDAALSPAELDLCRQWFDCVCDLNPAYLSAADAVAAVKLYEAVGMRVPNSLRERAAIESDRTTPAQAPGGAA